MSFLLKLKPDDTEWAEFDHVEDIVSYCIDQDEEPHIVLALGAQNSTDDITKKVIGMIEDAQHDARLDMRHEHIESVLLHVF